MNDLALLLSAEGKSSGAEKMDRGALKIRRQALGREQPETLASTRHLVRDVPDSIPEAFAAIRETIRHSLRNRHRPQQLLKPPR